MDLATNAPTKLEPFLLMGKSMKGAAAVKLIKDATSAPGVFVFGELLELQNVQDLSKSPEHASAHRLLELFAYGTYWDYEKNKDSYPELNLAQLTKLKHLSLATLAADRRIIPYSTLLPLLSMASIRELEDLIIDAIYLDILRGKLDQKEEQFEVEYTMGRDIAPGKVEDILNALNEWASTTSQVLATLDNKLHILSAHSTKQKKRAEEQEAAIQKALKEVHEKTKDKATRSGGRGAGTLLNKLGSAVGMTQQEDVMMDVDEPPAESKGKNRKAPPADSGKRSKRNRF